MVIQLSSMPVSVGNVPNSTRPKPEIMTPAALAQWCEAHCQSSVNAQEAKERSRAGATEQITPPPPPCRPRLTPTDHCRHVPGSRLQLNLAAAQYPDKACEMYATIKASCLSASLLALIQKSTPSTDHNCLRSVTTRIIQPCHMLLLYRRCKQHTSCVCQLSDLACLPMVVRISYFDSTAFFISWVVSQHISPLPTFTKPPPPPDPHTPPQPHTPKPPLLPPPPRTAHRHGQGELDLCDIHASKDSSSLTDAWQAFCKQLRWQMVEVQVDVVPFRPTPTPLPDFHGHRPRHHITRCQVLCCGSIPAEQGPVK